MKLSDTERAVVLSMRKGLPREVCLQTLRQYSHAKPADADKELAALRKRWEAAQVEIRALRAEVTQLRRAK